MVVPHSIPNFSCPALPRWTWLAFSLLCATVIAAYFPGLRGDFVFDDPASIEHNSTLHSLRGALQPPSDSGITVSGRPLLNFSFALNYAASGLDPLGYRLTNLALHFGSALLGFGLLRRLLRAPRIASATTRAAADGLAFAAASLWVLHPICTIAVTYVVQRAESLAAALILSGLYAVVRAAGATTRSTRISWGMTAIAAATLGATGKETTAVLPLLAAMLDRTLIAESARELWRRRAWIYVGMAAVSWPLLAWLVLQSGGRGGTAGFGSLVAPGEYLLGQGWALNVYLTRVFWPQGLVFDYGGELVATLPQIVAGLILTASLLLGTMWGIARNRLWAAFGIGWFLLFAPSSSFVPVATQFMSEHRAYLASLVVITAIVLGLHRLLSRAVWWALPMLGLALAGATMARNNDYRSEVALWEDTLTKRPGNARAHNNLGYAYLRVGRIDNAVERFRSGAELEPKRAKSHYDLGNVLLQTGQLEEAERSLRLALDLQPIYPIAATKLANARFMRGDLRGAAELYQRALSSDDSLGEAHANLASALGAQGDAAGAARHGRRALALEPDNLTYRGNLAWTLATATNPDARAPAEALKLLRDELAKPAPSCAAQRTAAAAHAAMGEWKNALRWARSALEAAGSSPDSVNLRRSLKDEIEHYSLQARRSEIGK